MAAFTPVPDEELAAWSAQFEAAIAREIVAVVGELADEIESGDVLLAAAPDDAERVRPRWRDRIRSSARALLGHVWEAFGRAATRVRRSVIDNVEPPEGAPADWRDLLTAGPMAAPLLTREDAEPVIEATAQALEGVGGDVVAWARDVIAEGIAQGEGVREIAVRLRAQAPEMAEARATRIARTEITRAVNSASLAEIQALGVTGTKTWVATHDDRVRPAHKTADEETVPIPDPFIVGGVPMMYPGDPSAPPSLTINCFPGDVEVQSVGGIRRVYRRWYEGVMVRVDTASGVQLTGTPNHPVLTMCCGWQPMQRLHVGCQLVKTTVAERVGGGVPEVDNVPTTLAEVYRAASESAVIQRAVGSRVDFHGDGAEREVEVVSLNGGLLTPVREAFGDEQFLRAHDRQFTFARPGRGNGPLPTKAASHGADSGVLPARRIGRSREPSAVGVAGVLHAQGQGGPASSDLHAGGQEYATYGSSACPKLLGDGLLGRSLGVEPDDLRLIEGYPEGDRGGDTGGVDPGVAQVPVNGRDRRAYALADLLQRKAVAAERDDVVKIEFLPYSGHVYNLETETGMYIGNSIATSNCRCAMSYTLDEHQTPPWAQAIGPGAPATPTTQQPDEWPEFTGWDTYGGETATMANDTTDELQSGMPPQLKAYWLTGEGAAKVRWGTPGSFDRCVREMRKEGVPAPEGTCANLYHEATGEWPGAHRDEDSADAITAAADVHTGAMVALVPSPGDVERLAVDGGEPADQLHLTVLYLGDAAAIPDEARANLVAELQAWADGDGEAIDARGFAVNVFNPASDEPCIVLGVGGDDLAEAGQRIRAVTENVLGMDGVEIPDNHTPWIPHVTLTYLPDATPEEIGARVAELTDRVGPITFDRIRVAYAGDVTDIPLPADEEDDDMPDEDDVTAAAPIGVADPGVPPGAWEGVLTVEGRPTGDGREFAPGALTAAPLPMPIMRQRVSDDGHRGSVVVGRIDEVWRDGPEVWGRGVFNLASADAVQAIEDVAQGFSRGISVDVDDISEADIEFVWAERVDEDGYVVPFLDRQVFRRGRLRGATLVSIPAFAEAGIQLGWSRTPTADRLEGPVMTDLAVLAACGCEAGAPPREWFEDPGLSGPTPLTVTDDGRVFGHGALWGTCHVGIQGQCVTPPREGVHAYYRLGEVLCADGSTVATGHITVGTGHASTLGISAQAAAEHYDNTGTVVADVASGEDAHGIWVAGALRPGVDAGRVRELRAAQLSGDWRRLGGKLRLVAMLAVNVPGFPVPRLATASSQGRQTAMVASGIVPAQAEAPAVAGPVLDGRVDELARRIGRVDSTDRVAALAARIGR